MGSSSDGIILIDKEEGMTSFDVVKAIRRLLKVKKVGHAGTLDPFATGLLILLLGQGTKLSNYLMTGNKVYQATMRLGVETDTQDLTGCVVKRCLVPEFDLEFIRKVAHRFVGEIEQVPPPFSAVNYRGKRAYELARRGIKMDLQKRSVKVHSLAITSIDLPDVSMEVTCSGGTYVRSLAADLGRELGPGAHLKSLRRYRSGPFSVKDALSIKDVEHLSRDRIVPRSIIPLHEALPDMNEARVEGSLAQRIRNGHQPGYDEVPMAGLPSSFRGYMKLVEGEGLVAIAKVHPFLENKASLKIMRVFN
jgi:tRNA pseudouridine55 synthase